MRCTLEMAHWPRPDEPLTWHEESLEENRRFARNTKRFAFFSLVFAIFAVAFATWNAFREKPAPIDAKLIEKP